ncbi:DUF1266 domain-containing protein [Streptomyces telluris]|uniref:DUF1266 domain-containing protein n=1 Tax=Streptomyces telluris TaxID=2720021 RepID=A0A9X2LRE1_9ACTN|nr:DUF1266 domain-containing protein [Streptomyces telluris]MCQ8774185.1 DUF1266 domain-containing protein [Streptomyces telluris]NJP78503.1 DUF1266 domain-containing protein [Streptomyces telluris]
MFFAPWTPPTDVEGQLQAATAHGDWGGQIGALAAAELYMEEGRAEADGLVPPAPLVPYRDPASGKRCLPVFTRGALPPWRPDRVFQRTALDDLALEWPHDKWHLAVNPGHPSAAVVPATPLDREAWLEVCAEAPPRTSGLLLSLYTGPLHGPLAHGLACGAPLAVRDGVPWNELGGVYRDYDEDRVALHGTWGIADPAGWWHLTQRLLAGDGADRVAEFALRAREGLAEHSADGAPATGQWREAVTHVLTHRAAAAAEVQALDTTVTRIAAAEEQLVRDAVLQPGQRVVSTAAHGLACAVTLARLALSARLCSPADAERIVLTAGETARRTYASWPAFSAGFLLGSALGPGAGDPRAGDPRAGDPRAAASGHDAAVRAHHLLLGDPASPWRNIPWS